MISIIIPACNEEEYIGGTIDSISRQNFKDYEVIVICNGCTDKTFDIVKKKADKVLNFSWRGISRAKNEGVKIAKYDKLLFLDADTRLMGDVLKEISSMNSVIGTCKFKPDSKKLRHKMFYFIKSELFSNLFKLSNGVIFCDKKDFSGFDEGLKNREDSELIKSVLRNNVKFKVLDGYVESSTRRYDNLGYLHLAKFWLRQKIEPTKDDYSIIR